MTQDLDRLRVAVCAAPWLHEQRLLLDKLELTQRNLIVMQEAEAFSNAVEIDGEVLLLLCALRSLPEAVARELCMVRRRIARAEAFLRLLLLDDKARCTHGRLSLLASSEVDARLALESLERSEREPFSRVASAAFPAAAKRSSHDDDTAVVVVQSRHDINREHHRVALRRACHEEEASSRVRIEAQYFAQAQELTHAFDAAIGVVFDWSCGAYVRKPLRSLHSAAIMPPVAATPARFRPLVSSAVASPSRQHGAPRPPFFVHSAVPTRSSSSSRSSGASVAPSSSSSLSFGVPLQLPFDGKGGGSVEPRPPPLSSSAGSGSGEASTPDPRSRVSLLRLRLASDPPPWW